MVGGAVLAAVAAVAAVLVMVGGGNDDDSPTVTVRSDQFGGSTETTPAGGAPITTDQPDEQGLPEATLPQLTTPVPPAPVGQAPAAGLYPSSVPSAQCTASAIGADTGFEPAYSPNCVGAWVLTRIEACPDDAECEGADVFRWTDNGWTYRGYFYAMCAPALAKAGMPPAIGEEFVGTWDSCDWAKYVVPEPATGPLELADEGERVRQLQLALIGRGLLFDVADGQYGPNTEAAVIDLQFLNGLTPDGIAGANTHAALGLPFS